MNIAVSIVIPFRDHENRIGNVCRQLAGYFKSLALKFEIIAVDEGSGDNSQAILGLMRRDMPELQVVVGRGYTAGVAKATASVLTLLRLDALQDGIPISLGDAISRVSQGTLDLELAQEHVLVCRNSVFDLISRGISLPETLFSGLGVHWLICPTERSLFVRAQRRGLHVQSYSPQSRLRSLVTR